MKKIHLYASLQGSELLLPVRATNTSSPMFVTMLQITWHTFIVS